MNVRTHNNKPNGKNINQNCGSTFIQELPKIVSETNRYLDYQWMAMEIES